MNKRPTEPIVKKPAPAPEKRTPKEEAEKKAMEKKYPFNKYAKGGSVRGGGCEVAAIHLLRARRLAEIPKPQPRSRA